MKILFLDDDHTRHVRFKMAHPTEDVTYVWSAQEAINALLDEYFEQASLDHDLGEGSALTLPLIGEGSGYDVACFISGLSKEKRPKLVVIHSWNPEGARRMAYALRNCDDMEIIKHPFGY